MIENNEWVAVVENMVRFEYILTVQIAVCEAVCDIFSVDVDVSGGPVARRVVARLLHDSGLDMHVLSVMERCTHLFTLPIREAGAGGGEYVNAKYHAQIFDLHSIACEMFDWLLCWVDDSENDGYGAYSPGFTQLTTRVLTAVYAVMYTHKTSLPGPGDEAALCDMRQADNQQALFLYYHILCIVRYVRDYPGTARRAALCMYALSMFLDDSPRDCIYVERQLDVSNVVMSMLIADLPRINMSVFGNLDYLHDAAARYPGVWGVFLQHTPFVRVDDLAYTRDGFVSVRSLSFGLTLLYIAVVHMGITSIPGLHTPRVVWRLCAAVRLQGPTILNLDRRVYQAVLGSCREVLQILAAMPCTTPAHVDLLVNAGAIDTALAFVTRILDHEIEGRGPKYITAEADCILACCEIIRSIAALGGENADRVYHHRYFTIENGLMGDNWYLPQKILRRFTRTADHCQQPHYAAVGGCCMAMLHDFAVAVSSNPGSDLSKSTDMSNLPDDVTYAMCMFYGDMQVRARAVDALAAIYLVVGKGMPRRLLNPECTLIVPVLMAVVCDSGPTEVCVETAHRLLTVLVREDSTRGADGVRRMRTSTSSDAIRSLLSVYRRKAHVSYRDATNPVREIEAEFDHSPEGVNAVVYVMCALSQFMLACPFFCDNPNTKRSYAAIFTHCMKSLATHAKSSPDWRHTLRDQRALDAILLSTVTNPDGIGIGIYGAVVHVHEFFHSAHVDAMGTWYGAFSECTHATESRLKSAQPQSLRGGSA